MCTVSGLWAVIIISSGKTPIRYILGYKNKGNDQAILLCHILLQRSLFLLQHLKQVIDILLDNAGKYSLPHGEIQLSLTRTNRGCLLSVSNPANGLSPQELKDIFRRFYRLDESRAMNQSYGLGLSIAEGIIKEHKGKIWAESRGGYITFFVQLACSN